MISYIRGELAAVEKEKVIVDVGGVGYGIYMPGQALAVLPQPGSEVKIHTYLNVREDAMQLFGFLTRDDLEIFKLVIGVSGIGPKGGLSILSKLSPDDLRYAVLSGDVKAISAAPGIGKKTAEKLIIELKDKLDIEDVLNHAIESDRAPDTDVSGGIQSEAVQAKETLNIYIKAAKERHEALDHVLFYGPPGLGKTTLAGIIANEMGVNIKITSGPAIEKPGEMAAILNNLQESDVLFVDEIHRLNRQVEEVLYPAMEDYAIDIMIGKGATARSIRLDLPKFTLVGATTRAGMLTAPLRDRFGVVNHLEFYTEQELKTIILRSAHVLGVEIDEKGALELAKRSRGTPRLANRLLKRVRDFAQVKYDGVITEAVANYALDLLDVDKYGLDHIDRNILLTMIEKFQGGPVGLETLAATISEDAGTLEDVYEPYLLKSGFIQRTPRGRVATEMAYAHLGIPFP